MCMWFYSILKKKEERESTLLFETILVLFLTSVMRHLIISTNLSRLLCIIIKSQMATRDKDLVSKECAFFSFFT